MIRKYKITKKKINENIHKTKTKIKTNHNHKTNINLKLKKELNEVYSRINFNKETYIKLLHSLVYKENKNPHNKYKTNLVIINITNTTNNTITKTKYNIFNKEQIPNDTRITILQKYMLELCKWIDKNHNHKHKHQKIDTCILFWISDRFIYEIKNIDKLIPICLYAAPKNKNYIIIPDSTFSYMDETKRYASNGLDWKQQKKLFETTDSNTNTHTDTDTKINKIFFRGADTTSTHHNLRSYIMQRLEKESNVEFKNVMNYQFLTSSNYESVKVFKNYKFNLNLPGHYPWSTRLKYLYLAKTFIINVRVNTIINKSIEIEEHYKSFIDLVVPDSYCINIDMNYYYSTDTNIVYKKENDEECEKVYKKIKDMYYKFKNIDVVNNKKVNEAYNIINSLETEHINEYYYNIILHNQKLGMKQIKFLSF
jgi:hypothetical protein